MDKIKSKKEKERKSKLKQSFMVGISLVLIFTMIFSAVGFGFLNKGYQNDQNGGGSILNYRGREFVQNSQGLWQTVIGEKEIATVYNPSETENIKFDFEYNLKNINGRIYYDEDNPLAGQEIASNLYPFVEKIPQKACLEGSGCGEELVKNCSDNLIVFNSENNVNNTIKIYKEKNCVFVNAPYGEQTRIADKIIFEMLDIQ